MGASKELFLEHVQGNDYDDLQYEAWFEFAGRACCTEKATAVESGERLVQRSIESHGNEIRKQLCSCLSIAQTYSIMNMIVNMRQRWGNGAMVVAMADSLHLEVYQKQRVILEGL